MIKVKNKKDVSAIWRALLIKKNAIVINLYCRKYNLKLKFTYYVYTQYEWRKNYNEKVKICV